MDPMAFPSHWQSVSSIVSPAKLSLFPNTSAHREYWYDIHCSPSPPFRPADQGQSIDVPYYAPLAVSEEETKKEKKANKRGEGSDEPKQSERDDEPDGQRKVNELIETELVEIIKQEECALGEEEIPRKKALKKEQRNESHSLYPSSGSSVPPTSEVPSSTIWSSTTSISGHFASSSYSRPPGVVAQSTFSPYQSISPAASNTLPLAGHQLNNHYDLHVSQSFGISHTPFASNIASSASREVWSPTSANAPSSSRGTDPLTKGPEQEMKVDAGLPRKEESTRLIEELRRQEESMMKEAGLRMKAEEIEGDTETKCLEEECKEETEKEMKDRTRSEEERKRKETQERVRLEEERLRKGKMKSAVEESMRLKEKHEKEEEKEKRKTLKMGLEEERRRHEEMEREKMEETERRRKKLKGIDYQMGPEEDKHCKVEGNQARKQAEADATRTTKAVLDDDKRKEPEDEARRKDVVVLKSEKLDKESGSGVEHNDSQLKKG
jgi:hypothetical protein